MRILITNLFAVALLLFGATSASAFAINMVERNGATSISAGSTVTVDVFLDAEPGIVLLSVGVLYDPTEFDYNGVASAALPIIYPAPAEAYGTTGALPGYILYAGGKPVTYLVPQQSPYWLPWPNPPAGKAQNNINYAENSLSPTTASGTNIWIGSMVFDVVDAGDGVALIELCNTCGGNVLAGEGGAVIDPATIPLTGTPITVTVPEPALAGLAFAALGTLALLHRRRRNR